jgi:hypothetical protein
MDFRIDGRTLFASLYCVPVLSHFLRVEIAQKHLNIHPDSLRKLALASRFSAKSIL